MKNTGAVDIVTMTIYLDDKHLDMPDVQLEGLFKKEFKHLSFSCISWSHDWVQMDVTGIEDTKLDDTVKKIKQFADRLIILGE